MNQDRARFVFLGIVAAVMVFAALYLSTAVFAPVFCALFIIALVWPLQRRLQAFMPQLLALALVICLLAVVFFVFAWGVAWGFGRIGRSLIADTARFQMLYDRIMAWLDGNGVAVSGLWSEHFNIRWFVTVLQGVSGRINTMISFWLVVLVYILLGLLEIETIKRKIARLFSEDTARFLIGGAGLTAAKFRRYMLIRTIMSISTGAGVFALAAAFGLQFAAEWGVIAFTLNYIPFIGPFVATLLPTVYALAQFESLQSALIVFACLNIIQFVIGSYIEPRVAGNSLAISPFLVLFSVFFWTFLWGLFGAFIGVPITIAILTFCAQTPATRWVAELFGAPDQGAK